MKLICSETRPGILCCSVCALAVLAGCLTPDTCTQGDNMTDPRLAAGLEQDGSGYFVRIQWDIGTERGAELPDAYFEDIHNVGTFESPVFTENELVASVELTESRELTVRFAETVDNAFLAENPELSFSLTFFDRDSFIGCTHPGMFDSYILDVFLTVDKAGELVDATLEQRKFLGAI